MFKEFKEFAMHGNVMDMAVGVIIGAAFGKIVSSLVQDIIMPPIGYLTGGVDFSKLVITIKRSTETTEAITINYGMFINTLIDFLIIAFTIYIFVRQLNRFKKKTEEMPKAVVEPSKEVVLLTEIRDLLKK